MEDFTLILCFIWATAAAVMAHRKKRNEALGFIFGYFLGLIAIIYYAVVKEKPAPKKKKAKK